MQLPPVECQPPDTDCCAGAPTVLHSSGDVGATDLLRSSQGESLSLDFCQGPAVLAQEVAGLLRDEARLRAVGLKAAVRARAWTEASMALELVRLVSEHLELRKTRDH